MHQTTAKELAPPKSWLLVVLLFLSIQLAGLHVQSAAAQRAGNDEPSAADGVSESDKPRSLSDPLTEEEKATPVDDYVTPEEIIQAAFEAPPHAKSLGPRNIWIDRENKRVFVDGYVAMRDGPLEMFACPVGTKEHESIVATLARSSDVHAALLAAGARSGTPVQYLPKFVPATGQRIRVWVCFHDAAGKFKAVDARNWIRKAGTKQPMQTDWVFAGSGFWKDPTDGREYYRADGGDMICVSNFSTAMMDVPFASSAQANELIFTPFSDRIPERGTVVRMVLVPIPIPSDTANAKGEDAKPAIDPNEPPDETVIPKKSSDAKTGDAKTNEAKSGDTESNAQ